MRAKKFLGQNFLKNKKILQELVEVGEVSKNDVVLEIGPGHGELTEYLAARAGRVIAIEKDPDLIPGLKEKFRNHKNIEIIRGDILKIKTSKLKIISNIPYYITSRFIRNFLTAKIKPSLIVLMVQYEVAKRIIAKPPDMNLLALSAQTYGKVEFIKKVSKGNFSPQPKVDSAIIKISEISDSFFKKNKISEKKFFDLARRAFQQKRKMLRRSLSGSNPDKFATKRPEELSLDNWVEILKN